MDCPDWLVMARNHLMLYMADKLFFEKELWAQGKKHLCGIDEAGRGPLAGPVVCAAVVFPPHYYLSEIDDSKKVSSQKREKLFDVICKNALAYHIAIIPTEKIDEINILRATLLGMKEAVENLSVKPDFLLIDGRDTISHPTEQKAIIDGDALSMTIGAASILAKVARDRLMIDLEKAYPSFSFSKHKGYGTKKHLEEIAAHGPTLCHRKSFKPVQNFLNM